MSILGKWISPTQCRVEEERPGRAVLIVPGKGVSTGVMVMEREKDSSDLRKSKSNLVTAFRRGG